MIGRESLIYLSILQETLIHCNMNPIDFVWISVYGQHIHDDQEKDIIDYYVIY